MMVLVGGKERTLSDFRGLAHQAGSALRRPAASRRADSSWKAAPRAKRDLLTIPPAVRI
jgi:hypothetical protein